MVATNTGLIQVQDPRSSYNGFNAFLDLSDTDYPARPIEFKASRGDAQSFNIDSTNFLDSGDFTGEPNNYEEAKIPNPATNAFFMASSEYVVAVEGTEGLTRPTCSVSPLTSQLTCTESGKDPRNVLSICPSTNAVFGSIYVDGPFLTLDIAAESGCEVTALFLIAA